jgi:hypothetical protein
VSNGINIASEVYAKAAQARPSVIDFLGYVMCCSTTVTVTENSDFLNEALRNLEPGLAVSGIA